MRPVISVNGAEVGILSSVTYVLEKILDMSKEGIKVSGLYDFLRAEYNVIYPEIWGKYIIFHRDARITGIGSNMVRHGWDNKKIRFLSAESVNIYIYRPIVASDIDTKTKVNIFNEENKLFYSSGKFPLRIKTIISDLTYAGTILDPQKPLDYRSGHTGCMVLSYISTSFEMSFGGFVFGYGVTRDGYVTRTSNLVGLGGGGAYANDVGCIVAYAPDAYPRWK